MKKILLWTLILTLLVSLAACKPSEPVHTDPQESAEPSESSTPPESSDATEESVPEDSVVTIRFSREGEVTELQVPMVDGTVGNYRIATNPELFRHESVENVDVFEYTLWQSQPPVYYAVSYLAGMSADTAAQGLALQNDGEQVDDEMIGAYSAKVVLVSGADAQMSQTFFYLIDHAGGCYMIETHFTLEMYEGLFPQMRALFDTFVIEE